MRYFLDSLLGFLHQAPPEITLLLMFILCAGGILGMARLFGLVGLFVYLSLAVVIANIQVLKTVKFCFFNFPVALGTVMFCSVFLATDIITEHYGKALAQKAIWVSFAGMLLMTVAMFLTLGFSPSETYGDGPLSQAHQAMEVLFLPAPSLLIASLSAYILSQYTDIWLFHFFKTLTRGRFLWLRTNLSTLAGAFLDSVIFAFLAWNVFGLCPMSFERLIFTYILGTYALRVVVALLNTPVIYLSHYCLQNKKDPYDPAL